MYKRLQEYNTSLQQYNSKLQSELNQTNEILKNVEKEKVAMLENVSNLRGHCTSLQDQLNATKVGVFCIWFFWISFSYLKPYLLCMTWQYSLVLETKNQNNFFAPTKIDDIKWDKKNYYFCRIVHLSFGKIWDKNNIFSRLKKSTQKIDIFVVQDIRLKPEQKKKKIVFFLVQ